MPTTDYKRDERLHVMHKCLKNYGANWTVKKLLEKVNNHLADNDGKPISARTIAADLKYLEFKKFAPIIVIKRGKQVFYTYDDDFELNQPVISAEENFGLSVASHVLKQLKGFPLSKDLEKLIVKLQNHFEESDANEYIYFEESPQLKNIHLLQDLFECIKAKTVLKISYRNFKSEIPMEKIIYPYFLKQYNQRWFLFGYDSINKRLDNSPLDRIISLKPTNLEFIQHLSINSDEYFKDIVGVTKPKGSLSEKIFFNMSKERAAYVSTKAIHTTQKLEKDFKNGEMLFSITVVINKELISNFLSFGCDLTVVKPLSLRERIKDEFKLSSANYL